jgi:hypothetical protein
MIADRELKGSGQSYEKQTQGKNPQGFPAKVILHVASVFD